MHSFLESSAGRVVVRAIRVYLQGLVGFIVAGQLGVEAVDAYTFAGVLANAASLALAPAVVSVLQNIVELLAKLDETKPELRG